GREPVQVPGSAGAAALLAVLDVAVGREVAQLLTHPARRDLHRRGQLVDAHLAGALEQAQDLEARRSHERQRTPLDHEVRLSTVHDVAFASLSLLSTSAQLMTFHTALKKSPFTFLYCRYQACSQASTT